MTRTITLEPGKTYVCRDGSLFKAQAISSQYVGTFRVQGEDEQGRITWRSLRGRFTRRPHYLDAVGESPAPIIIKPTQEQCREMIKDGRKTFS
jgi:hypothetical protein